MKIANILYSDELVNHNKCEYINYYKDVEYSNDIINKDLPTLIIGWINLKNNNINNVSLDILNKTLFNNKLYWEFSFNEDKQKHVYGVEDFSKKCIDYYFSKYNILNLDPVFNKIYKIDDLDKYLPDNCDLYYNYRNISLYVLNKNDIYCINLRTFDYFEMKIDDMIYYLNNKIFTSFYDENGDTYKKYNNYFANYTFLKRYIVTMLPK